MKRINPDDPAAPIDVIAVWGRNKLHPELPPTPIEWASHPGFSKRERTIIDIYLALIGVKKEINPKILEGCAGMAILATDILFEAMNSEGTAKQPTLYPDLKIELESKPATLE